jgi:hypothetical protein
MVQEQGGRRVNLIEPERSLLLLKATAGLAHEGGTRFGPGSPSTKFSCSGCAKGRRIPARDEANELKVEPRERVLVEPEGKVQLAVQARFNDGSTREVTRMAVYEPNNQGRER